MAAVRRHLCRPTKTPKLAFFLLLSCCLRPNYQKRLASPCSKKAPKCLPFEFFPDDCQIGLGYGIFVLLPEINANYEKWVESSN